MRCDTLEKIKGGRAAEILNEVSKRERAHGGEIARGTGVSEGEEGLGQVDIRGQVMNPQRIYGFTQLRYNQKQRERERERDRQRQLQRGHPYS